jgi:protein O-GlcNAc transferase
VSSLQQVEEALEQQQYARAEELLLEILGLTPTDPKALNLMGMTAHRLGHKQAALDWVLQALQYAPEDPELHFNHGSYLLQLNQLNEALAAYVEAMRLNPQLGFAYTQLALVLVELGYRQKAREVLAKCIKENAGFLEAYFQLGNLALADTEYDEALHWYEQLLLHNPEVADAYNQIGLIYQLQNNVPKALEYYQKTLSLAPDYQVALNNMGGLLFASGHFVEALHYYERGLSIRPHPDLFFNAGITASRLGNNRLAMTYFEQLLRLRPEATITLEKGRAAANLSRYTTAVHLLRAYLASHPEDPPEDRCHALMRLGCCLINLGRMEAGLDALAQAQQLIPSYWIELMMATALSPVIANAAHMLEQRERYRNALQNLVANAPVSVDPANTYIETFSFYLAYHGYPDRDLQVLLAQAYAPAAQAILSALKLPTERPPGPRRIAFVSRFFRRHSVLYCFQGLMEAVAAAEDLALQIFHLPASPLDSHSDAVNALADHWQIVSRDPATSAQEIANAAPDILIYADVGMDPQSTMLTQVRLAPVQAILSGHPITSGSSTVEAFISSELLEPEGAQAHYTEHLVQLPGLPMRYPRPELAKEPADLSRYRWPQTGHTYMCPMMPYKIHPDFDPVLEGILAQDPEARILFFCEREAESLAEIVHMRYRVNWGQDADRILFLPFLPKDVFLQALQTADVVLDTFPFGGGNTAYLALGVGVPIVTLPGELMRGRGTYAAYRRMDWFDCVALSPADYVTKAVRIATDPELRARYRQAVQERNAILFENHDAPEAFVEWCRQVIPTPSAL